MIGVGWMAVLFIVYALISRWLGRSPFTGPMLFTVAGLLFVLGLFGSLPAGEVIGFEITNETVQLLLEGTLAIVLFSDAVAVDYPAVRAEAFLPGRLLGIGLLLTIASGTAVALILFPEIGFWGAALIAIVLAPTDAALGQAVVSNEEVPAMVRQGLTVESGLNDGIAVPFLTIAIAGIAGELQNATEIAAVFIEEIGLAVAVGLGVGYVAAIAMRYASNRGWMGREGRQVLIPFLALFALALADLIGGSGFIAAFVGGVVFGHRVRREFPSICHFSEGVAHLLTMASFFVFGALILEPVLDVLSWEIVVYAVLSLTVIRMIPVALSLIGTSLAWQTVGFLGWFGPRGLASLVFVGTVVAHLGTDVAIEVVAVGAVTVVMSVFLHGVTAWPLSRRYASWFASMGDEPETDTMPEHSDVQHMTGRAVARSADPPMMGD